MQVAVDISDTMVALGEVAVWSFDLAAWGECAQAATEPAALVRFARRVGQPLERLEPGEWATGSDAVFPQDLLPATDAQLARTLEILHAQRVRMHGLLTGVSDAYPRWCGLPQLGSVDDLRDELDQSALHVRRIITTMPRTFRAEHRAVTRGRPSSSCVGSRGTSAWSSCSCGGD